MEKGYLRKILAGECQKHKERARVNGPSVSNEIVKGKWSLGPGERGKEQQSVKSCSAQAGEQSALGRMRTAACLVFTLGLEDCPVFDSGSVSCDL